MKRHSLSYSAVFQSVFDGAQSGTAGGSGVSTTTESELVVSFVSDFMSSYAHIKNHKACCDVPLTFNPCCFDQTLFETSRRIVFP